MKKYCRQNFADANFKDGESMMITSQPAITCSKLTMETLEPGVKYVQS